MTVYTAYHKKYPFLTNDPVYSPLHVGKSLSTTDLGFIGDNTGDNISEKNGQYSELTGLYWIWKNTDSDIVGLCHYRRFFFYKKPGLLMQLKKLGEAVIGQAKKRASIYYTSNRKDASLILSGSEISDLLQNYDAIIPQARKLKYSVWKHYKRRHHIGDLQQTEQIIREMFPDYLSTFQKVMGKKELLSCNMFIMKRIHFDAYMNWLFPILFELEKRTDVSNYDSYQRRLYGFISERLLDVWIEKEQIKTAGLNVLYFKKLNV